MEPEFLNFELSLLQTHGDLVGKPQAKLGFFDRLIWVKSSLFARTARGTLLEWSAATMDPAHSREFDLSAEQVARLAALFFAAGLPGRTPDIRTDPATTCDLWRQLVFHVKAGYDTSTAYELQFIHLEESADLVRLRTALSYLYRLAGCPERECQHPI